MTAERSKPFVWAMALVYIALLSACSEPVATSAPEASTKTSISVSGIGAGAYMATQYHLAHSASVDGLVSIGGGPYACAQGSEERALTQCLQGPSFDLTKLRHVGRDAAAAGEIDTLNHVAADRIFVAVSASGIPDGRVSYAVTRFYEELLDTGELAFSEDEQDSDMDKLIAGLEFVNARKSQRKTGDSAGSLRAVRYAANRSSKLPGTALIYEPGVCKNKRCGVHLHFKDCDATEPDSAHYRSLHALADRLSLVIVYPDAEERTAPFACWDWWGATSTDYAKRSAPQIEAIAGLIENLRQEN